MKQILTFFILLTFTICYSQNESSNFKLIEKKENSDINYLTIKNINSLAHGYKPMLESFKPIKGEFTTYIFIKEFDEISKYNGNQKFHDLIILKTNTENVILDGFYYRLEWVEVPSQSMIFRVFAENIELKNSLEVLELNFLNEYEMYNNQTNEELRKLTWCENDKLEFK